MRRDACKNLLTEMVCAPEVYKKIVGMQMLVEGLAMGAFATLYQKSQDPLLVKLCQLVMTDEAFHHKFGKIWADRTIPQADRRKSTTSVEDWAAQCFQTLLFNLVNAEQMQVVYDSVGIDWQDARAAIMEAFTDDDRRESMKQSANIFRVLIKTLLNAGIITDRTQSVLRHVCRHGRAEERRRPHGRRRHRRRGHPVPPDASTSPTEQGPARCSRRNRLTGNMDGLEVAPGILLWREALDGAAQVRLLAEVLKRAEQAPFYRPRMPVSGKPFSVEMTNFGPLGWVSDEKGYRYSPTHPQTGAQWPEIPPALLSLWDRNTAYAAPPECCLVNLYRDGARMGLHQDRDEPAVEAPVLSVSLGDTALFRIGGTTRRGPTRSLRLASGDVLSFGGPARLAYHGIDRVLAGSSELVPGGGRINLTLRRVTRPEKQDARPGG